MPFVVEKEEGLYDPASFQELPIHETGNYKGSSLVTISNEARRKLNHLVLMIGNTSVTRLRSVAGSNDLKQWYAVTGNDFVDLSTAIPDNDSGTVLSKVIPIPLTDYAYYRVQFVDSALHPLNIVQAGYFTTLKREPGYQNIPTRVSATREGREKQTVYRIELAGNYLADRISYVVSSPAFYHREAFLATRETVNHRSEFVAFQGTILDVATPKEIRLQEPKKLREYYLVVLNEDNPPLTIDRVDVWQQNRYLVAYLEKEMTYFLEGGDSTLSTPVYDLSHFTRNLPDQVPTLALGTVQIDDPIVLEQHDGWMHGKIWIWIALILAIGLLAYLTREMLGKKMVKLEDKEG